MTLYPTKIISAPGRTYHQLKARPGVCKICGGGTVENSEAVEYGLCPACLEAADDRWDASARRAAGVYPCEQEGCGKRSHGRFCEAHRPAKAAKKKTEE